MSDPAAVVSLKARAGSECCFCTLGGGGWQPAHSSPLQAHGQLPDGLQMCGRHRAAGPHATSRGRETHGDRARLPAGTEMEAAPRLSHPPPSSAARNTVHALRAADAGPRVLLLLALCSASAQPPARGNAKRQVSPWARELDRGSPRTQNRSSSRDRQKE